MGRPGAGGTFQEKNDQSIALGRHMLIQKVMNTSVQVGGELIEARRI